MKEIIEILTRLNKTIATMESCTGGGIANAITNVEGSSEVLKFSAVTYANEYKIKMGVAKDVIDHYSVYSIEVANEMSKKISDFAQADYGIGVTGKLNRVDKHNLSGQDNLVYISIYDRDNNQFYNMSIKVTMISRQENKDLVIEKIINELKKILN
jgi:nicotinamide-nucleotide amidase